MGNIRVRSFDFDGCIANQAFKNAKDASLTDRLKNTNQALLAHNQDEKYDTEILMNGSNRQSYFQEIKHVKGPPPRPASFSAMQELTKLFQSQNPSISFDRYQLADSYAVDFGIDQKESSFDKILQEFDEKRDRYNTVPHEAHTRFLFDASKVTLLYAQMHRMASQHRDNKITFDFYDDREDILNALHSFYTANPELIPPNVTLRLYQYNGEKPPTSYKTPLSGTPANSIDDHYAESIKEIAKLSQHLSSNVPINDDHIYQCPENVQINPSSILTSEGIIREEPENKEKTKEFKFDKHTFLTRRDELLKQTIDDEKRYEFAKKRFLSLVDSKEFGNPTISAAWKGIEEKTMNKENMTRFFHLMSSALTNPTARTPIQQLSTFDLSAHPALKKAVGDFTDKQLEIIKFYELIQQLQGAIDRLTENKTYDIFANKAKSISNALEKLKNIEKMDIAQLKTLTNYIETTLFPAVSDPTKIQAVTRPDESIKTLFGSDLNNFLAEMDLIAEANRKGMGATPAIVFCMRSIKGLREEFKQELKITLQLQTAITQLLQFKNKDTLDFKDDDYRKIGMLYRSVTEIMKDPTQTNNITALMIAIKQIESRASAFTNTFATFYNLPKIALDIQKEVFKQKLMASRNALSSHIQSTECTPNNQRLYAIAECIHDKLKADNLENDPASLKWAYELLDMMLLILNGDYAKLSQYNTAINTLPSSFPSVYVDDIVSFHLEASAFQLIPAKADSIEAARDKLVFDQEFQKLNDARGKDFFDTIPAKLQHTANTIHTELYPLDIINKKQLKALQAINNQLDDEQYVFNNKHKHIDKKSDERNLHLALDHLKNTLNNSRLRFVYKIEGERFYHSINQNLNKIKQEGDAHIATQLVRETHGVLRNALNNPHNEVEHGFDLVNIVGKLESKIRPTSTLRKIVAGLICVAGALIIAGAVTSAVASFGGSIPAALLFLNFGTLLIAKGLAIGAGVGATLATGYAAKRTLAMPKKLTERFKIFRENKDTDASKSKNEDTKTHRARPKRNHGNQE